ncbi:MAG TPA: hypothetical protein VFJ61_13465 [Solirubrobacterales bacterium]|nr:hypothetical protein [Solirubrobacterales bacterium]
MRQGRRCFLLCALILGGLMAPLSAASAATGNYGVESAAAALSTTQAGAHADFTVSFKLFGEGTEPNGKTKDVIVTLPPGLIGNPQGFPRCSVAQLGELPADSKCPQDAQVGIAQLTLGGGINGTVFEPVYNMYSPGGDIVARFGLFAGPYPSVINVRVNPVDYSLIAKVEGAPAAAQLISAATTFWGVPASPIHDGLRLTPDEALHGESPAGGRASEQPERPFLSNPTECGVSRPITVTAISYQAPASPSTEEADFPVISGCDKLSFNPVFQAVPTNPEAAAPTGLEAVLEIPQSEAPKDLATATLKSARVTLPEGFTVNSAAADGLEGCNPEQVGFGTTDVAHCPDAAKLGSAELDVPALERTLHGAVYQRTPEPGHLFRFWLVTDEQGVHLKLPAEIEANPLTGQLTTVFSGIASLGGNPQVPFEELRLHIFGGPRAPLATPSSCGTYSTAYSFAPWSGKPPASGAAPMQITSGCGKGGFNPKLQAGTVSPRAGSFSPFTMTLTRQDGEANPETLAVHLPQGLLAKLGGVPLCPEASAGSADCPSGSQVGTLAAATGVGGAPLWIPQPGKAPTAVYLAGPYKGAPYSVITRVPAQAGPFDLGTVVNRAGIYVDPESATATIKTDPLPQILEGVPVLYRTVHVDVDRKNFTLNPTGCAAKEIKATVTAVNGATATPSDGFQATNCAKLAYKPKLKLTLKGATRRTGHPATKAVLTQGKGQSNTAAATVILPSSEFIDQNHINNPCTRVQFNAGKCPRLSILGRVTAVTPLLDQPLKGPVYFRSNGGARELPDIVADLRGPIHVTLVGFVDAVHKKGSEVSRIRTRFANVPDAPVTKFTMNLFGGPKRGLLVNSRDLCKTGRRAKIRLLAQNGRVQESNSRLRTSCGKHG